MKPRRVTIWPWASAGDFDIQIPVLVEWNGGPSYYEVVEILLTPEELNKQYSAVAGEHEHTPEQLYDIMFKEVDGKDLTNMVMTEAAEQAAEAAQQRQEDRLYEQTLKFW